MVRLAHVGCALLLAVGYTQTAAAIVVGIDPGPVGTSQEFDLVDFDDLNGTPLEGQALSLQFEFANTKHVRVEQSMPGDWYVINLFVLFLPGQGTTGTGVEGSDRCPGCPERASLTDEDGNILITTGASVLDVFQSDIEYRATFSASEVEGLIHHGFTFDLVLWESVGIITHTIVGAQVGLRPFGSAVLTIGEWVPASEPETVALLLAGLSGYVLMSARCRRSMRRLHVAR